MGPVHVYPGARLWAFLGPLLSRMETGPGPYINWSIENRVNGPFCPEMLRWRHRGKAHLSVLEEEGEEEKREERDGGSFAHRGRYIRLAGAGGQAQRQYSEQYYQVNS